MRPLPGTTWEWMLSHSIIGAGATQGTAAKSRGGWGWWWATLSPAERPWALAAISTTQALMATAGPVRAGSPADAGTPFSQARWSSSK